jgi:hypothetical protein
MTEIRIRLSEARAWRPGETISRIASIICLIPEKHRQRCNDSFLLKTRKAIVVGGIRSRSTTNCRYVARVVEDFNTSVDLQERAMDMADIGSRKASHRTGVGIVAVMRGNSSVVTFCAVLSTKRAALLPSVSVSRRYHSDIG